MIDPKVETRKVSKLKPHEFHGQAYPDLPEAEFRALVENIGTEGIRVPLEILPDDRIIAGRHRYKAAKELRLKEVPVVVRHDLADGGEAAIRVRIVEDNLVRRQLSPFAQARALLNLKVINAGRPAGGLTDAERAELRDELRERLGKSPREVNRYLAVLRTPRPVQDAFERGKLGVELAAKVGALPEAVRAEIADALQADPEASPAAIVGEHLDARFKPHTLAKRAYERLLGDLRVAIEALSGELESIPRPVFGSPWHIKTLRGARELLKELIVIEKKALEEEEDE